MLDDFDDTNDPVQDYLVGLQLLDDLAGKVDIVVPGHGSVGGVGHLRARIDQDRTYVRALRDGHTPDDPRINTPQPGWEWVADIHAGQARSLAQRRKHDETLD